MSNNGLINERKTQSAGKEPFELTDDELSQVAGGIEEFEVVPDDEDYVCPKCGEGLSAPISEETMYCLECGYTWPIGSYLER